MNRRTSSSKSSSAAESSMLKNMETALEEYLLAQRMQPGELLDHVRKEEPHAFMPPMIEGVMLTNAGMRAIGSWARISREADKSVQKAASAKNWQRAVEKAFVTTLDKASTTAPADGGKDAAEFFNKEVLEAAKKLVELNTGDIVHYVPCYLFSDHAISGFSVGPVQFIRGPELPDYIKQVYGQEPEWKADYLALLSGEKDGESAVTKKHLDAKSIHRMASFPWIAVVRITDCEPGMSQKRAYDVVRLVIAGVGLMIPSAGAADIGIASERARPANVETMLQRRGKDVAMGFTSHYPQIRAGAHEIKDFLNSLGSYLKWLGSSVSTELLNHREDNGCNELRKAWLNGLYWYYVGVCETVDARAIICHATCLESLAKSNYAEGIKQLFTSLFGDIQGVIIVPSRSLSLSAVIDIIYNTARSGVVHGGQKIFDEDYETQRGLSTELSRYVLIRYQEYLDTYEGQYGKNKSADGKEHFLRWSDQRPKGKPQNPE